MRNACSFCRVCCLGSLPGPTLFPVPMGRRCHREGAPRRDFRYRARDQRPTGRRAASPFVRATSRRVADLETWMRSERRSSPDILMSPKRSTRCSSAGTAFTRFPQAWLDLSDQQCRRLAIAEHLGSARGRPHAFDGLARLVRTGSCLL
jgi:hypothetical protein